MQDITSIREPLWSMAAVVAAGTRHLDIVDVMGLVAVFAAIFIVLLSLRLKSTIEAEALARKAERAVMVVICVSGIAIGGLAYLHASQYQHRWGIILAFLPYLLILQHAVFLRIVRRPVLTPLGKAITTPAESVPVPPEDEDAPPSGPQPEDADADADESWWRLVLESAKRTTDRYFGPVSLAVRYGTAAMAVLLVGLATFLVLFVDASNLKSLTSGEAAPDYAVHAAQLGAAGAYMYVVVYLARRNFTHDVTSGGAMWCSIVLAVGPILAGAISYLLHVSDAKGPPASDAFGVSLIYFMAGLSPRFVLSYLESIAKKAWGSSASGVASTRTLPAVQVAGVTPEIAERLEEEGISDVHGLAMADPLRLIRNTNFDRREIVSWIDEAILIDVFPEHWKEFEREGITGAVDLVSLVYSPPYKQYKADTESTMKADRDAYLDILSKQVKLSGEPADRVKTIKSVARRLVDDAQLRLIWVLHNHIADESAGIAQEAGQAAPA